MSEVESGEEEEEPDVQPYYLCEEIQGNFNILSINIRSYHCNAPSFLDYVSRIKNPNILLFQETWALNGHECIPGYQAFESKIRKLRKGGGVCIAVREGLQYSTIDSVFIEGIFESIGIRFKQNNKNYALFNIYINPKTAINTALEHINSLRALTSNSERVMYMGDFNIDLMKVDKDNTSTTFFDDMTSNLFVCETKFNVNVCSFYDTFKFIM